MLRRSALAAFLTASRDHAKASPQMGRASMPGRCLLETTAAFLSHRFVQGDNVTRAARRAAGRPGVRARTYAATLLVTGSLALAGCSESTTKDDASESKAPSAAPSTPTAASGSPSADPGAAVEALYRKYWDEKVKAYGKASVQGTDLKKYAVAEAYLQDETEVKALKAKGLVATGKPVLAPEVDSVDMKRKTPHASLTDCTDVSQWTLVKKSSGQAVTLPQGRLTKYITKVEAEKWYGNWVIVKITPQDQTC
ncbi:hypothetical protein OG381_00280 [Streptomyces sp. NBC_00490]|uniref:hypothetical protein n=1 Tax=Streptomyces sp. NBC_00490 TaxID=2903657 RepID=UPI002E18FF36